MRKRFLALSALGVGAGALFALKTLGRGRVLSQANETPEADNTAGRSLKTSNDSAREFDSEGSVGSSMGRIDYLSNREAEPQIDDRGTDQSEASNLLKNIRDAAFDASDEKLALALGRPPEEVEEWISGSGIIDGDVVMKARVLASERGVHVE